VRTSPRRLSPAVGRILEERRWPLAALEHAAERARLAGRNRLDGALADAPMAGYETLGAILTASSTTART